MYYAFYSNTMGMALTTTTLIETFLQTDISPNDLLVYIESILLLRKKYGKKLYNPRMMESIKQTDVTVYTIIHILVHYNKQSIIDLKYLVSYIKKNIKNYIPNFTITAPTNKQTEILTKQLDKRFPNSSINTQNSIDLGITITGEGWHYKRNLDQDIHKILG